MYALKRRKEVGAIDPIANPFVVAFVVLLIVLSKSTIFLTFFGYGHNNNSIRFGVKHHIW
jgi:hydrogenase-4 membrane subunit HyfE